VEQPNHKIINDCSNDDNQVITSKGRIL